MLNISLKIANYNGTEILYISLVPSLK